MSNEVIKGRNGKITFMGKLFSLDDYLVTKPPSLDELLNSFQLPLEMLMGKDGISPLRAAYHTLSTHDEVLKDINCRSEIQYISGTYEYKFSHEEFEKRLQG